jgi:hypothetical protein
MLKNNPLRSTSSGPVLERTVKSVMEEKGFLILSYSDWIKNPTRYAGEVLLTNAPYESIYHHKAKTEFLLISEQKKIRLRIECKWQQVAGSVDEKFPYLYLNIIEAIPENDMIVIIDGDGFKPGAIEWFKKAVAEKKYAGELKKEKNIIVMNLKQFMTWANTTFRH